MVKYCKGCGVEIKEGAYFCPQCGKSTNIQTIQSQKTENNKMKPNGNVVVKLLIVFLMILTFLITIFLSSITNNGLFFLIGIIAVLLESLSFLFIKFNSNEYKQQKAEKERTKRRNQIIYQQTHQTTQRVRRVSPSTRVKVFERDNYTCQMCGRSHHHDGVKLEVDHILPVSRGGSDNISNLQTLCFDCNRGKSNKILHNHIKNQR